jgi:hypothetical protein
MNAKLISTAAAAALLFGTAGAMAQNTTKGNSSAPGQQYNANDKMQKGDHPGASGYAPGQQYRDSGKVEKNNMPGASGYAPGQQKGTTGSSK